MVKLREARSEREIGLFIKKKTGKIRQFAFEVLFICLFQQYLS